MLHAVPEQETDEEFSAPQQELICNLSELYQGSQDLALKRGKKRKKTFSFLLFIHFFIIIMFRNVNVHLVELFLSYTLNILMKEFDHTLH